MGWKLGAAEIVLVVTLVVVVNDVATSVVVNFRVRTVVCSSVTVLVATLTLGLAVAVTVDLTVTF